jgi:sec-independent protein translocase protein TatC
MSPEQDLEETNNGAVMSLGDHVQALRTCLIRALMGIGLVSIFMFWQGRGIVWWLCQPLFVAQRQLGLPMQTVNLSVAGGFTVYVKVSLIASLAVGAPWIAYQLWRFIAPGLHASERRAFRLLVPYSAGMTLLSLLFLYYLFLPAAISFLLMFSADYPQPMADTNNSTSLEWVTAWCNRFNGMIIPGVSRTMAPPPPASETLPAAPMRLPMLSQDPPDARDGDFWFNRTRGELRFRDQGRTHAVPLAGPSLMVPMVEINEYLGFVVWVALVLVIAFQLPVVMTVVAALGLFDPASLARRRKYFAFACFMIGIVITPNQDIVSNVIFPVMLWGLFELGLVTSRLVAKRDEAEST